MAAVSDKSSVSQVIRQAVCSGNKKPALKFGCPTWIRTMTKASKGLCATVTPSDKLPQKVATMDVSATYFVTLPWACCGIAGKAES